MGVKEEEEKGRRKRKESETAKKKRRWEKRMVGNILLGVNTFHLETGGREESSLEGVLYQ